MVESELELVALARALGAEGRGGALSDGERSLLRDSDERVPDPALVSASRAAIASGCDPLGDTLCALRSPKQRRPLGAFYTSASLIEPMIGWVLELEPERVVDPGCGSGRFSVALARRRPGLRIVAVDADPLAALLTRAGLAVVGATDARVLADDFTRMALGRCSGRTAFVGNPPYVRHHQLGSAHKRWATRTARRLGHEISGLAGLHVHFFLATAAMARPGDVGCFVTSSEWLDVNYGSLVRALLTNGLGGASVDVLDPRAVAFDDAMTTAAITCFEVGSAPESIHMRMVRGASELSRLGSGEPVAVERLQKLHRWGPLFREGNERSCDTVKLGTIARVHRGSVTGANAFFTMSPERARELGLERWCRPVISSAKQILDSDGVVRAADVERVLLCLPRDARPAEHPPVAAYLEDGVEQGVDQRYVPAHRKPWWSVNPKPPPPIVASYMARQPPRFALNPDGLVPLNIAHGIYPRAELCAAELVQLVAELNASRDRFAGEGRTYHGGLEKFEPREMERLRLSAALAERLTPSD